MTPDRIQTQPTYSTKQWYGQDSKSDFGLTEDAAGYCSLKNGGGLKKLTQITKTTILQNSEAY